MLLALMSAPRVTLIKYMYVTVVLLIPAYYQKVGSYLYVTVMKVIPVCYYDEGFICMLTPSTPGDIVNYAIIGSDNDLSPVLNY